MTALTVKEAADQLRCSLRMVYKLFKNGELEGYYVGSGIRIFPESVETYIESHRNRKTVKAPLTPRPEDSPPKKTTPFTAFQELHL